MPYKSTSAIDSLISPPIYVKQKIGIYQKRDAVSIKSTVFVIQSRNPGCTCIFPLFTLRNYESNEDDAPAVSTRNKTPQYIYFFYPFNERSRRTPCRVDIWRPRSVRERCLRSSIRPVIAGKLCKDRYFA